MQRYKNMWFVFALGSAVFAALTSILAKVGIDGVNSNLATALRTVVVVIMAWGMVFLTNAQGQYRRSAREAGYSSYSPDSRRAPPGYAIIRRSGWATPQR